MKAEGKTIVSCFYHPPMRSRRRLYITSKRNDLRVIWGTLSSHTPESSKTGDGWKCGRKNLIRENWPVTSHQPHLPISSRAKAWNASLHHKPNKGGSKVITASVSRAHWNWRTLEISERSYTSTEREKSKLDKLLCHGQQNTQPWESCSRVLMKNLKSISMRKVLGSLDLKDEREVLSEVPEKLRALSMLRWLLFQVHKDEPMKDPARVPQCWEGTDPRW